MSNSFSPFQNKIELFVDWVPSGLPGLPGLFLAATLGGWCPNGWCPMPSLILRHCVRQFRDIFRRHSSQFNCVHVINIFNGIFMPFNVSLGMRFRHFGRFIYRIISPILKCPKQLEWVPNPEWVRTCGWCTIFRTRRYWRFVPIIPCVVFQRKRNVFCFSVLGVHSGLSLFISGHIKCILRYTITKYNIF